MNNQGKRDRQGTAGQTRHDPANPTGTSGRPGQSDVAQGQNDANHPPPRRPVHSDDDEESGLGNRITNR